MPCAAVTVAFRLVWLDVQLSVDGVNVIPVTVRLRHTDAAGARLRVNVS